MEGAWGGVGTQTGASHGKLHGHGQVMACCVSSAATAVLTVVTSMPQHACMPEHALVAMQLFTLRC